jgi:hypothetical protein
VRERCRTRARRIEWRIGRLLGEPPGSGRRKVDPDLLSRRDERYMFRLIGTLELDWDELDPWARSRAQLVTRRTDRAQVADDAARHPDRRTPSRVQTHHDHPAQ